MNTSARILLALASTFVSTLPPALAAAPQVEETLLGPTNMGGSFAVSPRGAHAAYVGRNGTHLVVTVDGVAGPAFDDLYLSQMGTYFCPPKAAVHAATQGGLDQRDIPVLFSVDGEHHAYVGRQGAEYVVVHDGKEIARGPRETLGLGNGPLTISPGGRHVYWSESSFVQGRTIVRPMLTGKPGPWCQPQGPWKPVFSADESRYAYYVQQPVESGKPVLIVDGKAADYSGQQPVFTADGKLLLAISHEGGASLLVNGKPAIKGGVQISKVVVAPVGQRYAAIVRQRVNNKPIDLLYIDGELVSGSEYAQDVWFSPDGKRYAAICHDPSGGPYAMVIDGDAYGFDRIDAQPPYWTADSSKIIFTAGTADSGSVLVVEDDMFPYSRSLTGIFLPEEGNRYAWGTLGAGNDGHSVIVGTTSVLPGGVYPTTPFVFSPDGSRYGYLVAKFGRADTSGIVIDGAVQPGVAPSYFGKWMTNQQNALTPFAFSRDGKHVAFMGIAAGARTASMYLDGKVVHPDAGLVLYPTFTPDSQHLFWLAAEPGSKPEAMTTVYVDGQPAVRATGYFFKEIQNTFEVDRNGVATYLAADGEVAKRYRITAPSDTSIAKLLASSTTAVPAASPAPKAPPPAAGTTPPPTAPTKPTAPPPAAAAGPVVALAWNDLVRRPEARPTTCTVNKDFNFQGGVKVRAGTKVNILEVKPGALVVGTTDGRTNFQAKPEETDALAVANVAWSQLTPVQRELTYPALLQRRDLWAYRLKLALPFALEGRKTRIGDPALLLGLEGNQLLVRLEGTEIAFNVEAHETDLMAQARAILADERGAPGRLLEEFVGKLVSPIDGQPVKLDADARPKYVVMYMGAGWCPPCQAFAPKLVKLLQEKAPEPSDVTLLYLSGDRSPADVKAYVSKLGIAWPTIVFKNRGQLPAFASLFGDSIPQLVVTDRHGKVLVDSAKVGTEDALTQLRQLL